MTEHSYYIREFPTYIVQNEFRYSMSYEVFNLSEERDSNNDLYMEIANWCIDNFDIGDFCIDDPLDKSFSKSDLIMPDIVLRITFTKIENATAFKLRWML